MSELSNSLSSLKQNSLLLSFCIILTTISTLLDDSDYCVKNIKIEIKFWIEYIKEIIP